MRSEAIIGKREVAGDFSCDLPAFSFFDLRVLVAEHVLGEPTDD